jgi:hypothetical protein
MALLKSKVVNEYVGSAGDITKMDWTSVVRVWWEVIGDLTQI